ncbi:hypothetical protein [Corynebacterium sp. HMSC076D02]|uniref:hypothetical protein n=1 Tax=Corynebacterium sp. HMSC076D02 TaxID=1739439 RepID=UPI0008A10E05|nr:hypothetical protein [Corynebacterium sp. HMSC076D02]OFQ47494.1 hypothetical protein HMPREF2935_02150 [Corynebacterium sp. HMSC076D02]
MPTDVTYPILNAQRATELLEIAKSYDNDTAFPAAELKEIGALLSQVIGDDKFVGSAEDVAPTADLLNAFMLLLICQEPTSPAAAQSALRIASLGALAGNPAITSRGFRLASLYYDALQDSEKAWAYAKKAAQAGDDAQLIKLQNIAEQKRAAEEAVRARAQEERAKAAEAALAAQQAQAAEAEETAELEPEEPEERERTGTLEEQLNKLRDRLETAKSENVKEHSEEFVDINRQVQLAAFSEENSLPASPVSAAPNPSTALAKALSILLESAVGALWACPSFATRSHVANKSNEILRKYHLSPEYSTLPAGMLARFYADAAGNNTDTTGETAADFYGLAAKEYSRNGNEARELEMLLRKVEVFLIDNDRDEAHDILASRYVNALKYTELPIAARWTVLFSETLRTEAENMFKSTQVLMDFLGRHPIASARSPLDFNALAEVVELLGDRYTSANDTVTAREKYRVAYELFNTANNQEALAALAKKA